MAFYKRRNVHVDTPADIRFRLAYRAAATQAIEDRKAKFPLLTSENFDEAAAYQTQRVEEIMKQERN